MSVAPLILDDRPLPDPGASASEEPRVFELGATMTLLLLLFFGSDFWYLQIPLVILCSLGLLYRSMVHESNLWFLITVFLVASNFQNWYTIDNHKYLITYWCLAWYLAASSARPLEVLRVNARLLIGLAFLFASLWKILSSDFLNHEFFYHTLLLEPRFSTLSKLLGGATDQVLARSSSVARDLRSYDSALTSVAMAESARLLLLAKFLTWWTVLVEWAIALAFCWPAGKWSSRLGDALLLLFLLTTYASATVIGFGWVLSIMGMVSTSSRKARVLYISSFLIIFLYSGPWSDFFTGLGSFFSGFLGAS